MTPRSIAGRAVSALALGLAIWLSGATFAAGDGGWLAVVPTFTALATAIGACVLLVTWFPPRDFASLLPLVAVLLPWAPGLDTGLVYSGPLLALVWAAVVMLGWGDRLFGWVRTCGCATSPARSMLAAFLISLAAASVTAWSAREMIPMGDEPHYLVAAQSLMKDGDLRVENNHLQGDHRAYFAGDLHPQFLARGKNREIYPVHAPGLSALAVPAFAIGGYGGVVVFLILLMALASALLWRVAHLATGDIGAAWFGWAVVATSCTWLFQSFLVFPDAAGAAALTCGLWLVLRLERDPAVPRTGVLLAAGAAMVMLPWLHTRFAVLAAGAGVIILLRLRAHGAAAMARFLAIPVIGAAAWFAFFIAIYGTPNPLAPWGGVQASRLGWLPSGVAGLLFDQQFGILPYAPAIAAGIAGLAVGGVATWRRATRLQIVLLIVVPYVAASATYAMWWAGFSVPARLLTSILPVFAPAAAALWVRARAWPAVRATLIAMLAWGVFASAGLAFAQDGTTAWNVRQRKAGLWFEWVAPLLRWTEALPAFFKADDSLGRESLPLRGFYVLTAVWAGALFATTAAASWLSRVSRIRASALTATALILMLPVATVAALRAAGADASARETARVAMLDRVASREVLAIDLGARRMLSREEIAPRLRLTTPAPANRVALGALTAGRYRVTVDPAGEPAEVFIARGTGPIERFAGGSIEVALPVSVDQFELRGAGGRRVTVEPLDVPPMRWRQRALRALRYGRAVVYFLDGHSYAEPDGFWVGGSRYTNVVVQGDPGVRAIEIEIRNAPAANHLAITGAAERVNVALEPAQIVVVPVTLDERGTARLQIESAAGFIPATLDPQNRDFRYLGVYVTVR